MRTTILVEDHLGTAAQAQARREGLSFSALVSRALEEHLARRPRSVETPPFRLVVVGGGGPRPGLDLDRTSELLTTEDEAAFGPGAD